MSPMLMRSFITRLKNKNVNIRKRAARDLELYVRTELRELSLDEQSSFNNDIDKHIQNMVSSSDNNEKIGGVLTILCLFDDIDNKNNRLSRFANFLRDLLPSSDLLVMELAAKTVGKLALNSGIYADTYVEFEVKRAFELLAENGPQNELKRLAAVLILKEIATMVPTLYFKHAAQFFDLVLTVTRDPNSSIRNRAIDALRAALIVTAQRETSMQKSSSQWYIQCYEEIMNGINVPFIKEMDANRDDRIHGALLALDELLRVGNIHWERQNDLLIQRFQWNQSHTSVEILSLLPQTKSILKALVGSCGRTNDDYVRIESSGILYESTACKHFLHGNYNKLCSAVLIHRSSKSDLVNSAFMKLLPRLAAFNKSIFVQNHLNLAVLYIFASTHSHDYHHRNNAFITLGLMAMAVKDHIRPYLTSIFELIRSALSSKENINTSLLFDDSSICICITLLGIAVHHSVENELKQFIEPLMAMELNLTLIIALKELAEAVPILRNDLSKRLLSMLSQVLNSHNIYNLSIPIADLHLPVVPEYIPNVVLALRTLRHFNFEGHSLFQQFHKCIQCYLCSNKQEFRIESIKTCCRLLHLEIESQLNDSLYMRRTIFKVINQILYIGVSDKDPYIRYMVFNYLNRSFDLYLARDENIVVLLSGTHDKNFEIRQMALCTLARLSLVNPAIVLPQLRSALKQCLYELKHWGIVCYYEQNARLVDHLAVHAPHLVSPYVQTVLEIVFHRLAESDRNSSILICIGDLAQVSMPEMSCWTEKLMPILLDMLCDGGSQEKRGVALWVLGKLVEGVGYIGTPYTEYPTLLDTLLGFLKIEQQPLIRRETIRVLGLLGALDPYKYKINLGKINSQVESTAFLSMTDSRPISETEWTTSEMLVNMSTSTWEEYYSALVISTLVRILRDPKLFQHHTIVVQAITFILQSLGTKCVPYIKQVVPGFLNVIRTVDDNFRDYLLLQLGVLINIVGQHIQNYMDDIYLLIEELWTQDSSTQCTLIQLIEYMFKALGPQFQFYLSELMPNMIRVLRHDSSKDCIVSKRIIIALLKLGRDSEETLNVIIPPLVHLFDATTYPIQICQMAMETITEFIYTKKISPFDSLIINATANLIENIPELRKTAMETLCALICLLGRKFVPYIPLVSCALNKCHYKYLPYDTLITHITSNMDEKLDENILVSKRKQFKCKEEIGVLVICDPGAMIKKIPTSLSSLQKVWLINRCVSKDDWLEWLRRLGIDFLKESPSPVLRSCWALAQAYSQLPKDLFNAAFISCWTQLTETLKIELVQTLEQALMVSDLPEVTQTILNLAEFMDHCEVGPLPIDTHILGERAMDVRAYAKALHYKEVEFTINNRRINPNIVESLIFINNKLQQNEAASGLLEMVMSKREDGLMPREQFKIQSRWYEKLHNWEQALSFYEKCLQKEPHNIEWSLGEMRCLESLGQWEKLNNVAASHWFHFPESELEKMSRLAAAASWKLKQWKQMTVYVECIPRDTMDGAIYRAVLSIHEERYELAQKFIDLAREIVDTELTAMAAESYQRAYGTMVSVQMLAELEEVIQYKLKPEKREIIYKVWWDRLQGCQRVVEDWQRIIQVHSLVLSPEEDKHTWIKYAALCRKSSRVVLSHNTLVTLLGTDPSINHTKTLPMIHPHITFAYIKHMWTSGEKSDAYNHLKCLIQNVSPPIKLNGRDDEKVRNGSIQKLLARCFLKLGYWQEELQGLTEQSIHNVLKHYYMSKLYDSSSYKAWHSWAYMNFKIVQFYKNEQTNLQSNGQNTNKETLAVKSSQYITQYTGPAIEGFFYSISLSKGSSLQDTLRLLTLWFEYGEHNDVYSSIVDGLKNSGINTWLQVIPQLIARIDTPRALVNRLLHKLLIDIGKEHPQSLIYPLTVANKSASLPRRDAAKKILKSMCEHSPNLVQQAAMVSDELLRVAILWHELWYEALEEASRLYFCENNVNGMFKELEPLHIMLIRGPQTLKECSFKQTYGKDLGEALEWCNRFLVSGNDGDMEQAWLLYYNVFRKISSQLPQLTKLELHYVSHKLQKSRDMELAVPGSYIPGSSIVKISYIHSSLSVITSKQRPRKLRIKGSDGNEYMFLLKGHEDLRQDERVMQFFGLVNTLLQKESFTDKRNFTIQRYAVIPLSTNSGLIGWVPHCETLHTLIRNYRSKKKILLNIEHRIMLKMAPNYDKLTLMQKVEVFEHALANTHGNDLARLMWLRSPSSEVWFDRRTNYIMSIAVMSMVGYILGLGDRHPSNLMLDRLSGKILHIDFGDCFEVAMTREKFPEKIPFRLTRMLINAMDITGIEGTYRRACEHVMTVLRHNKDSLMAVLEAFVYDPLLNWRLLDPGMDARRTVDMTATSTAVRTKTTMVIDEASCTVCEPTEALNKRALAIVTRVRDKLTGRDFMPKKELSVPRQVYLLTKEATAHENLCQCYIGWCPFW